MSRTPEGVFDVGLQAERTALAWRRTTLAMAVAAVGAGRLALPTIGTIAVAVAGLGLVQVVVVGISAERRYRLVHRSLTARGDLTWVRHGGLPVMATGVGGMAVSGLALAFVIGRF